MGISNIEWSTIREEARNAAVAVHDAREKFLANKNDDTRTALIEARDAWTDKVIEFQAAVTKGLVLTVEDDELQDRLDSEDLLDAEKGDEGDEGDEPASTKDTTEREALLAAEQKRPEHGTAAYDGGPNARSKLIDD